MKTFVKILSMLVAVVMLISVGVVGMTAYAEPTDVLGNYDFTVVDDPYKNVDWNSSSLYAFKSSTHAHTVRSDADIELNDTIWYHYMKGYDVLCLTDHGTVNGPDIETNGVVTGADGANGAKCGWTESQDRCALYGYQSFVHGNIDEISYDDYYNIISGKQVGTYGERPTAMVDAGRGMFNLPLGNEANAVSGNKCHVNCYNVSVFHGATRSVEWPESTVANAYNSGAVTRINHVGEWAGGNDDPGVYDAQWIQEYVLIYERYCPNRPTYTTSDTAWNHTNVTGQIVKKGVIGMELVNTSDNRTRNDRYYVYDESLKFLAPQGINVYGFCEDDSHEESDIDKNAQFFLVNDGTAWSKEDETFTTNQGWLTADNTTPWYGYTGDIIRSMTMGEFYCSSVNSKNSYELGDGFTASGKYPSINNFAIDDADTDQITISVNNASKVRLVADGNIIATKTITETEEFATVTFDLNAYEDQINSYVRIYMTGKGGITYLQPTLLSKTERVQSYVQFVLPSTDTTLAVYDSNNALIETKYTDNIYVLPAGDYSYTATRKGYITKTESFTVTQADVDAGTERIINIELEKDENVNTVYFYAPETIYLNPADSKTFLYYIDRENADDGALISSPNKTDGNVYFHRKGATNVKISASYQEGATSISSYTIGTNSTTGDTISTTITAGSLSEALTAGQYVLMVWTAQYTYDSKDYITYTYSYIYPTPTGTASTLSAGAKMTIDHNLNSAMHVVTSVFAYGLHRVDSAQSAGYEYAPYLNNDVVVDNEPYVSGSGFTWRTNETSGSSAGATSTSADIGYIYADKSRINNFNQVPLLQIGFDINNAEEADQTDTTPYYTFYFANSGNVLASMSGTKLEDFAGKRIYISNNGSSSTALNYAMSSEDEVRYVVHGEAKGVHEVGPWLSEWMAQATSTSEVYITVIRTDKSTLRNLYNQAVSNSYQQDWFSTPEEYNTYRDSVINAAKILGNPAATPEDIANAEKNLVNSDNGVQLLPGTAQVKHYWVWDNVTGEISVEDPYSYTLSDVLVANAIEIEGFTYAKKYERIVDDKVITTGTADYESVTAAEDNYVWIFYYIPETYKISYNTGTASFTPSGGSGSLAIYGQDYTITTASPSRAGYTFAGWYLDVDPTQTVYSSGETIHWDYMEAGQFNANWVPLEYTVSFDLNGGVWQEGDEPTDDEKDVTFDEVYQLPLGVPVRTGYNFLGWQINGGEIYTAGSQFTWDWAANGELVAQWSNAEYQITYEKNADDATVTPASGIVYYDKAYGTLATAQRTGYSYQWYSDPNCQDSALVTADTIVKIPTNHTLYAKWTPITYSINYNLDGGLVTGVNPTEYTIESSDITLINPTKTGYEFAGWSGTDIDTSSYQKDVTIPTGEYGDRTYTAHWDAIEYSITYNLNVEDSSLSQADNSMNPTSFTYADIITIKPATRTGYSFSGWTGEGYTAVQSIDIPAGTFAKPLTFDASWTIIQYQISYDLGGGTAGANSPTTYNIESATVIDNPTRGGYTFYGWQSSALDEITDDLTIPAGTYGDIMLTAVWTSDKNEIIYELNGGAVNGTNPTTFTTGDTFTIINPEKTGYEFAGWDKFSVNTGVSSSEPMMNGTITSTDFGTIVFTARWTPINYNINYDIAGGHYETAVNNNVAAYTAETPTFTLTNPIKEGYIFAGWSGTDITGVSKSVTINKGSIGDRSYVATWTVENYTITYDFAGGASTASCITTYNIETADKEIGAPVRTGYNFAGWTQTFQNFTWKTGELDENGFYNVCDKHYVSNPILLRSGYTYTMSTDGSADHIVAHFFTNDTRTYTGSLTVSEYPDFSLSQEGGAFVYLVVSDEYLDAALRDTIKITVVDNNDPLASQSKQESVSVPKGSTGNFTLTADWSVEEYDISYDLDGGALPEGAVNPSTYNVETPDFTLTNPTREGYSFLGWEYEGTTSSTVAIKQGSTGDRNYTATWTETMYTINYFLSGGTVDIANRANYYSSTETFTLNNPTRTGFTFSGWTGTGITGTATTVTIEKGSTGNRVYTATWTPDTYNIAYTLNGGVNAAANPNTYTYETETFTLAHPTKTGAIFSGWTGTDLSSPEMTVTINKGSTGDKAYVANWSVSNYTISYNLAGGNDSGNPATYTVDTETFTLKIPTRSGYTFAGWTGTGLEQATEYVTITKGSTGNRSYTATWTPVVYNINYVLGSGAQVGIANPTSYTVESATITLNNPVRTGYVFLGWSGTDIDSTDGYAQTITIYKGSTGNRNYTANWEVQEYHITYALNGGTAVGNPTTYTITSPDFTLNNPTRTGYTFVAWSGTGITGTGLASVVTVPTGSTGNRTYTANWELTKYTITYDLDGGNETIANPKEYNYLSSPITLHNPTKSGYDFVGWVASTEDGEEPQVTVTIPTNSTGDKYYRAMWSEGQYTITYDLDEGSWPEGYTPVENYTYATADFTIPEPVKAGYIFAGWSGTGISGTTKELTVYSGSSGNRTYIANWAESENIITYNLNGGTVSGDQNPTSYVTGTGTIVLNNPVKSGYRFTGWTGSNGDTPEKEVVIDTANGGALSFTANWTAINYKVSYVLGGGSLTSGITNPTTYTVEDQFTLNNPTRTGYTFKGWTGTALDGTQPTVTVVKGSTGARTYTAVWEETVFTVTYDYGAGAVEFANPTTYTFTTPTFTLNNPTLTGYTFIGWTGTDLDSATMTVTIAKGSLGDRSYVANYSVDSYTIKFLGVDGATFNAPATEYAVTDEISIPNPTKIGYIFNGWSGTGILGMQKDVVIPVGSTGDRVYTANFTPVEYSIDYDLDSGRVSGINPKTYTIETAGIEVLNPGRAGFTFDGWTLSIVDFIWFNGTIDANGNVVDGVGHYSMPVSLRSGTTYTYDSSIKLAIFDTDGKFITLANSGSYTADADYLCSVVVADEATEAELAAVALTVSQNVSTVAIPRGNMGSLKLVANWISEQFTITYYLNGGALAEGVTNPTSYDAETPEFTLNNPTRTGYIFTGWTGTDLSNTTTEVTVPVGSTGNRIYSANWRIEKYYLSINLDGGQFMEAVPEYFTVDTPTFSLPIPVKSGHTFTGWLDESGNVLTTVTITKGSTGARSYTAQWTENSADAGTHRIYYHGMNNQIIGFEDVQVGSVPVGRPYQVVIGYQFAGWSVSLSDPTVVESTEDVHIYSKYVVGPDTYSITVKVGDSSTTTSYAQYATVRVTAAETDANNNTFSHWADENGAVVSYYRTFSFKAHTDATLVAVYGGSSTTDKVATRVTKAEYDSYHKWVSFYAERSVASEYTVLQHGIMFTDSAAIAGDDSQFIIGTDGVYVSTASSTSRSGVYTLSIGGLTKDGNTPYAGCETVYARSYVTYADANGVKHTVYSDVTSFANPAKDLNA